MVGFLNLTHEQLCNSSGDLRTELDAPKTPCIGQALWIPVQEVVQWFMPRVAPDPNDLFLVGRFFFFFFFFFFKTRGWGDSAVPQGGVQTASHFLGAGHGVPLDFEDPFNFGNLFLAICIRFPEAGLGLPEPVTDLREKLPRLWFSGDHFCWLKEKPKGEETKAGGLLKTSTQVDVPRF